ncbi:MAG: ypdA [Bacteroidetes bacterium]|jgi:tetratricopeptide (TPR) repeat protein|nr:ypdA [Bacteroidota bacterium]
MKRILPFLFCLSFFLSNAQSGVVDSLLLQLKTAREDTNKVNLLFQLSESCDEKDILKYAAASLSLARKLDHTRGIGNALNNLGYYYDHVEYDREKALAYYSEAAKEHASIGNAPGLLAALINTGLIYESNGLIEKCLEAYQKGLEVSEKSGDRVHEAKLLNFLGNIYERQGLDKESLRSNLKALKIQEEIGDTKNMPGSLTNIAGLYIKSNEYDKSRAYYLKALEISRKANARQWISLCLYELGHLCYQDKDLPCAFEYFTAALKIYEEMNDKKGMAFCNVSLSTYYFGEGNREEGIRCSEKALKLGRELQDIAVMRDASRNLALMYEEEKKFDKAYPMMKLYKKMSDSLDNAALQKAIVKKQLQFDYARKERELKFEQEKKEVQSAAERKTLVLIIIGLAALLVAALAFGWLFIRQKRILADQKNMQLEQKLLRSQMNPHFIFNCLQAIQNYVDDQKAVKYLSSFGMITRSVLENSRLEAIPLSKEIRLLQHYLDLQQLLNKDRFTYSLNIEPDTDLIKIPPMLLQPFIENAIEHGFSHLQSGGQITISVSTEEDYLILEVVDNGSGLSGEKGIKDTSLATTITQERISLLNKKSVRKSSFTVSAATAQQVNPGVRVRFRLPL